MAERDPSCSLQCHCARLWFAQGFGQCLGTFPWNAGWRSISAPISGDPDERIGRRWWSDDLMVQLFRMRTSIMMNMMMMTMTMMIHHDAAAVVVCSSYSTYRDHKKNPVQRVVLQMRCFTARCLTTPSRTTPSWRPAWNVEMWPPLRRAHGETCWIVWLEGVGIWWQSDGIWIHRDLGHFGTKSYYLDLRSSGPYPCWGFPQVFERRRSWTKWSRRSMISSRTSSATLLQM